LPRKISASKMPTWTWKPVAWGRDKTTRILLLVVSTNIGASLGAFVVIPFMCAKRRLKEISTLIYCS
jgi:hypothetical protein